MFTHQISELSKLGEYDPQFGQGYWVKFSDDLTPAKFNSQNQHIGVGDTIEFEEKAMKRSAKGNDYFQLRKVKVVESESSSQGIANTEKPPEVSRTAQNAQLDRIEAKLDKLIGIDEGLKTEGDYDQSVDEEPEPEMPADFLNGEPDER